VIVVADTSPLNYLIQIDRDNLLPELYKRIVVPMAAMRELSDAAAPGRVRIWISHLPAWVEVGRVASAPDVRLLGLGPGEREAIQLCEELNGDLLPIDEKRGRREAKRRGLRTTGTLGVLLSAADSGLFDADAAYRRLLKETSFRTSTSRESQFLEQIRKKH
jgi:predicted nucleic acid-binding protein